MRTFLAALALLALASCTPAREDGSCLATRDCSVGERCAANRCLRPIETRCAVDGDCGPGGACLDQVCFGGTRCGGGNDCGEGEYCDLAQALCIIATCDEKGGCPNEGGCDFSTNRCGPPRECVTDRDCLAPKGRCDGGLCAAGCGKTGCASGESCVQATGRCNVRTTCHVDVDCGAPTRLCEAEFCVPGCSESGCPAGESCSATTGRCSAFTGPCSADAQCGAPARVCSGGACVGGCATSGCSTFEVCSSSTGRCDPKTCTSGAECSAPAGRCQLGTCAAGCGATGCTQGTCDGATGECAQVAGELDATCSDNTDCLSGYCHIAATTGAIGRCSELCGATSQCPAGFSCLESPEIQGVRACLGPLALGHPIGTRVEGQSCTAAADCHSGLCTTAKGCLEACSSDAHCTFGSHCRAVQGNVAGTFVQVCLGDASLPGVVRQYPLACSQACASFFCEDSGTACLTGCCKSADCPAGADSRPSVCVGMLPYFTGDASQSATVIKGCVPSTGAANAPIGASCALENGTNCRSNFCVANKADGSPTTPYCSDSCCTDADCGSGFACVAALGESNYSFPFCARL